MTGKFHLWRKTCSGHSTFSNVEQVLLSITSRAACVPVLFEDKCGSRVCCSMVCRRTRCHQRRSLARADPSKVIDCLNYPFCSQKFSKRFFICRVFGSGVRLWPSWRFFCPFFVRWRCGRVTRLGGVLRSGWLVRFSYVGASS